MPWLRVYVASVVATTAMASDGSGSSVLADNASFVFDGTTSDIAQQLYRRFQDNDEIAQLSLNEVPDMVAQRLSAAGVAFEDLPGTLQRAVLWDSGFVISPNHDALQLWTLDGRAITDLAVSYDEFLEQGCTAMNCSQPNNEMYHSNQFCDGDQMLGAARCVIEEFTDGTQAYLAMWSNGGDTNMIPEIRAVEHSWQDTYSNKSYVVYAVHTHDEVTEPAYATCPSNGYGSLVLPCYPNTNLTASVKAKMTEVEPSQWVTEWLEQYQSDSSSSDDSGFDMVLLIPIILVPLIIILLVVFCCLRRRQLKREKASNSQTRSDFDKVNSNLGQDPYKDDFHSPDPNMPGGAYSDVTRPTDSTEDTTTTWGPDQTIPFPRAYPSEDDNSSGSNRLIYVLQNDPNLAHNRIPFEQIHFQTMLSKGAFGEVWMSELQGQQVAVKRLLQSKQSKFDDIQAFTDEIQLSASLKHPNVVQFVGVAWNTLYNLVMVVEYLPMGDLQTFLKKQGDLMTWARDKVHIAIGIARALDYLHNREPALIHRDIKSKNVLLTRDLEPQLIDFGVSRRRVEATMTAGVGTPYWTAPEVLDGQRYTEQSDIYSFGVLLSEIDSGKLPYHDAVGPQGEKLKPFQILNDVMGGVLRPSFSEDCPPRIRRIGVACLQQDATRRPKARDLVHLLGG